MLQHGKPSRNCQRVAGECAHLVNRPFWCNVLHHISAATKGCLVFMMAPFLKSTIQQAMTEDLNRMKEYIETQTNA